MEPWPAITLVGEAGTGISSCLQVLGSFSITSGGNPRSSETSLIHAPLRFDAMDRTVAAEWSIRHCHFWGAFRFPLVAVMPGLQVFFLVSRTVTGVANVLAEEPEEPFGKESLFKSAGGR